MNSIKLFRAFGLDIKTDWTLLVLIMILMSSFSSMVFNRFVYASTAMVVGVSVAFALSFILSIFTHEMGHVIVGRRYGVHFSSITLFLFGGAAKFDSMPRSPKAEAVMAIAGPITSISISFSLFVVLVLARIIGIEILLADGPVPYMFTTLIYINVMLGTFNMIPMFPLDGGRVFRAAVWKWKGSFVAATEIAVRLSRGFSYGMMFSGALMAFGVAIPFFGVGIGSGLWIAAIGFLIRMMGTSELKAAHQLAKLDRTWA